MSNGEFQLQANNHHNEDTDEGQDDIRKDMESHNVLQDANVSNTRKEIAFH
jgi:hypothetical protein